MTDDTTPQIFHLPDVGEGLTEAEIVTWHVSEGDVVNVNDVLVEIETAKSIVELPSPYCGVVSRLVVQAGETVAVGNPIIEIGGAAGGAESPAEKEPETPRAAEAAVPQPADDEPKLLVGYGASAPGRVRRRRRGARATVPAGAAPAREPAGAAPEPERVVGAAPEPERVGATLDPAHATAPTKPYAKPPVRRLAKELGVDLREVPASGPNGTVSREDVHRAALHAGRAAVAAGTTSAPARGARGAGETRIPIKGVRKATAAAMVQSAFTAPHVTEFVTVDVTKTLELRETLLRRREFSGIKLTPLALIARAYLIALSRTPIAAASWDEASGEIVIPSSVNLGIAAATPRGLLVPNIKHADSLTLVELATKLGELTETARAGRTAPADLAHGTTTITNIGVFGIDTGTPILNPGETSILAVGAINRRPWVVGEGEHERIEPRSILQLALSFDHRVLDGAEGSKLLSDTAELLAEPALAML